MEDNVKVMRVHSYIGEIRMYVGGARPPQGWAICDGSVLQISQYELLFSQIWTTFGGDGVQTFGLPDLRGRVPVGIGQDGDTPNLRMGQPAGSENITISAANLSHSHPVNAATSNGSSVGPQNMYMATRITAPPPPQTPVLAYGPTAAGKTAVMNSQSVAAAGTGTATVSIVQFYQVINYIIALDGEPYRPQS